MSLHSDHRAHRDLWPEEHDALDARLEDYTPANAIEAVPAHVRRRYAAQEAAAQAACRPLAAGVHVQPIRRGALRTQHAPNPQENQLP